MLWPGRAPGALAVPETLSLDLGSGGVPAGAAPAGGLFWSANLWLRPLDTGSVLRSGAPSSGRPVQILFLDFAVTVRIDVRLNRKGESGGKNES